MTSRQILVHLGAGMGNMLMATPMIEMLSRGGSVVDLCLQGETPHVETLFERWPHVRRASSKAQDFEQTPYTHYIVGDEVKGPLISFPGRERAIVLHPMWDWQRGFDLYSEIELYSNLARAIVPDVPPIWQTSCATSGRHFDEISKRTVVLIPGGQRQMPIRKWLHYGALARHFDDVAVVGVPSDLDLSNRIVFSSRTRQALGPRLDYPGRAWALARRVARRFDNAAPMPDHVKSFVGKLSLADTAALIEQAGYVIGNDCGLTHLSVALGKTTFALLGPTSRRKVFPAFLKNVHVVSLEFECQPCQEKPGLGVWRESLTQCFCPYRLRCMDELSPEHVLEVVRSVLRAQ